jgi:hypothetical protein
MRLKGCEKLMKRLEKGRKEAEFVKKMTERSTFSATEGIKRAKQQIQSGLVQ